MPLVNRPAVVTFTLVDASGSRSQATANLIGGILLTDARTAAQALATAVEAASDCTVESYAITFPTVETQPVAPALNSRVEKKGRIQFRTSAGKVYTFTVPGIVNSVVLASGQIDEDLALITGITLALLASPWSDSNGATLDQVIGAYERFDSTSKGQLPSNRRAD